MRSLGHPKSNRSYSGGLLLEAEGESVGLGADIAAVRSRLKLESVDPGCVQGAAQAAVQSPFNVPHSNFKGRGRSR